MNQFDYVKPPALPAALTAFARDKSGHYLGGGTNLVDLMKMGVVAPSRLVDITGLPLKEITADGTHIHIGAMATNTQVADHPIIRERVPLLSLAINAGASPQIRNMATMGGNLLQRTRCPYFFDTTMPCNKRAPGSGCAALTGYNRMHAIFGGSDRCIAVHPSDMSVALAALDAEVLTTGAKGSRTIPIADFYRLPGDQPQLDNTLQTGEIITGLRIPVASLQKDVAYLKVRDRTSYAFALVSAAVSVQLDGRRIVRAQIALGGVAHKPWRVAEAENHLAGKTATDAAFSEAADIIMRGAKAYRHNGFKLRLAPNVVRQALKTATTSA